MVILFFKLKFLISLHMYVKDATDHTWSTVDIALTLMYNLNHNDQQCT